MDALAYFFLPILFLVETALIWEGCKSREKSVKARALQVDEPALHSIDVHNHSVGQHHHNPQDFRSPNLLHAYLITANLRTALASFEYGAGRHPWQWPSGASSVLRNYIPSPSRPVTGVGTCPLLNCRKFLTLMLSSPS
jgi:hypothetical protein